MRGISDCFEEDFPVASIFTLLKMRARRAELLVLSLATWAAAAESTPVESGSGSCASLSDCGSCLRTPGCHWCASSDTEKSRCVPSKKAFGSWCKGFSWGPKTMHRIINNGTNETQLFPQHAQLRLRVGETETIKIVFKRLQDYPIDLYYLLDLSETMRGHKNQISKLGHELAYAMKNVTKNFRLGFGSFVDKVKMPFVFTAPELLEKPCPKYKCATPHAFKNHMPLDNDPNVFSRELQKTPISTNNDSPEGGLDALMQAMVCTEKIKWRADARHLLIFATDDMYHIAGDGKLAGAVEPNPEKCIMNDQDEYVGYADYDYPTISQINKQAIQNNMIIIFAVKQTISQQYAELTELIQGSRMEVLSPNAKNIINFIIEVYNKFEKSVKLLDDAGSKGIGIIYYSNCSDGDRIRTNECNNIKATSSVSFDVDITAKSCPPNLDKDIWRTTINISPHGINEKLQLDIEVFCSCPCEFKDHKFYEKNSSHCNHHGTRKCGVCECDDVSTGETCECKRDLSKITEESKLSGCISNDTTNTVCSGRGFCICGTCLCHKRPNPEEKIYGKHCQCDNFSCMRHNGLVCSGSKKGHCVCGICECEAGWTGKACECLEMQTACVAPGEDRVCSGLGTCVCGKCECEEKRSGKYCGDCMPTLNKTCSGGRCKEFADCVECLVHETGRYAGPLCSNCSIPTPELQDSISETNLPLEEKYCKIPDDSGCSFVFTYVEELGSVRVKAVRTKECSAALNLIGIVLGISGTTLFLVILAILIWKLIASIHDRREYARYVSELENTQWAAVSNPRYKPPTRTTVNPTYGRQSRFSFMLK